MQIENEYRTKDWQTASVLHATNHKLIATEWEGRTCHFVFEDKQSCLLTVLEFINGKVQIDAKKLFDSQNNIKAILLSK